MTNNKGILSLLIIGLVLVNLISLTSTTYASETTNNDETAVTEMYFFFTQGCKDCDEVKDFMDTMDQYYDVSYDGKIINSRVDIFMVDISDDENYAALHAYYNAYSVPEDRQFVPSIFIGDKHYMSAAEIKANLIKAIESGKGLDTETVTQEMIEASKESITLSGKSIAGVVGTGLLNGLNPCSISMILFLFSLLLTKNVNVLKLGFAFIIGKFITYILLGSIFYNLLLTLNIDWLNTLIKVILIVVLLGLSLMNFLDFISARKENYGKIKMQLPAKLRKINHKIIKRITDVKNQKKLLHMCFLIGVVISIGEFLCTGQIYLATIVYVLQNSDVFNAMSLIYLIMYSAAFTVPLIVITIIVHKTKSFFDITEIVRGKMHLIKLLNALFFLVFLIVVILWY